MYRVGHDPDVLLSSLFSAFVSGVEASSRSLIIITTFDSDMICLQQLFRDAYLDPFRTRSHGKPAELKTGESGGSTLC